MSYETQKLKSAKPSKHNRKPITLDISKQGEKDIGKQMRFRYSKERPWRAAQTDHHDEEFFVQFLPTKEMAMALVLGIPGDENYKSFGGHVSRGKSLRLNKGRLTYVPQVLPGHGFKGDYWSDSKTGKKIEVKYKR